MENQFNQIPLAFHGMARLYGLEQFKHITHAHVCIVGIGGVGSWIAEALARSGVGHITLIDLDEICTSNINRQLHSLHSTVGQSKIQSMQLRMLDINPQLQVHLIEDFLTESNLEQIFTKTNYDVIIDAIDSLKNKCLMAYYCYNHKIPLITIGGAGGIQSPLDIKLTDLNLSFRDKLLMRLRKRLRRDFGLPKTDEPWGIDAVFSPLIRHLPPSEATTCDLDLLEPESDETRSSLKLDCQTGLGTASFVTGSFGFVAAAQAIQRILQAK